MIKALRMKGLLVADLADTSTQTLRKHAQHGIEEFGNTDSAYGKAIAPLDVVGGLTLEVVNPFACLTILRNRHAALFRALRGDATSQSPRRLLLYVGEVRPGNPLRPNKGRQTPCFQWAFVELPDHVLTRSDSWFVAAAARST